MLIALCCVLAGITVPQAAYADDTTASSNTTSTYSLYDTKQKNQQITINKIWNDGLTNDDRKSNSTPYQNMLAISIMTGVPQSTLRTYQIVFDANGGSFGTDNNGNSITTNTLTYNAKNVVTAGTYAAPERTDGYICIGWSTSSTAIYADNTITNAVNNSSLTNQWLNARTDKSATTLYAVWKDLRIHYAVMAYGTGVDIDRQGNKMGLTFGPALGYSEFSQFNGTWPLDTTVTPTMTRHHTTADIAVMNETSAACTDDSHSIITDADDVGTDAAGNRYRCLHYDNWNTIIYWNKQDPHVYDKCIKKGCSKTVIIMPTQTTIDNGIFNENNTNTFIGDGNSYIMQARWNIYNEDDAWNEVPIDITQAKQGYGASLIRAKLVGADSHTNTTEYYAGSDALTKYTVSSSILSCFPKNLQNAIGYKDLSIHENYVQKVYIPGTSRTEIANEKVSNDNACDKLWLLSVGELNINFWNSETKETSSGIYPDNSIIIADNNVSAKRSVSTLPTKMMLRIPDDHNSICCLYHKSGISTYEEIGYSFSISPGFTLSAS